MNHDVDDGYLVHDERPNDLRPTSPPGVQSEPSILTRLRDSFAMSSIGLLFSSRSTHYLASASALPDDTQDYGFCAYQHSTQALSRLNNETVPPRCSSPTINAPCLPDLKRIITTLGRSRQSLHSRIHSSSSSVAAAIPSSSSAPQPKSPALTVSELNQTPPLTPDCLTHELLLSSSSTVETNHEDGFQDLYINYATYMQEEQDKLCDMTHSLEIKEGKRPERPIVCTFELC